MQIEKQSVRYDFTHAELLNIARDQARFHEEKKQAEEEFESQKSAHKNRVSVIEANISDCTRKVSSGYEMRMVPTLVLKFRPVKSQCMSVRLDNLRVVRVRDLEEHERQLKIGEKEPEYGFDGEFVDVDGLVYEHVPLTRDEFERVVEAQQNQKR